MIFYPAYQRHHPHRTPAWRWNRAQFLLDHNKHFSHRRDDAATGTALAYLRAVRRGVAPAKLAQRFPDLASAQRLFADGGLVAHEIEARLLARQSVTAAAASVALPVEVLRTYEATYFDIRDRLNAVDWITTYAIEWWRSDASGGRSQASILKAYAYHGGLTVLEAVLPTLLRTQKQAPVPADLTTPTGRLALKLRLAVALDGLSEDVNSCAQLAKTLAISSQQAPSQGVTQLPTTILAQNSPEQRSQVLVGAGESHLSPAPKHTIPTDQRQCA